MSTLKFIFKSLLKQPRRRKRASGFTLIELLVALILTFLIITPLLSLVISFMTTDRQEQAKNSSQQEIQAALDYIAQDMQQAVYIYDATGLSTGNNAADPSKSGIQDQIPPSKDAPGCEDEDKCVPVLALWKRKYLDKNDEVDSKKIATLGEGSDRFVYSLVVYYLIKNDPSDPTWSKVARIGRFEIRDGILDPGTVGNATPMYLLDPDSGFAPFDLSLAPGKIQQSMNSWVKDDDPYEQSVVTLVDYIDDTAWNSAGLPPDVAAQFTPPVNDIPADVTTGVPLSSTECQQRTGNGSSRVPPDPVPTELDTGSFYACVNPLNAQGQSVAQVVLRGNALPRLSKDENRWKITEGNKTTQLANRPTASVRVAVRGLLSSDEE